MNGQQSDGISMYMGTNNREITFRQKIFGQEPEEVYRPNQGYDCTIGKKYKMQINIYKDRADYSVDGWTYAYSYFPAHGDGSIPEEGFFGFAVNKKGEHKEIENVVISNIDEESNHMMSF